MGGGDRVTARGALPILSLAREIAAFGTSHGLPIQVKDDRWGSLLGVLVEQRLTGLAVAASAEASLGIAPRQRAELLARHREAMLRCLSLERVLLALADEFDALGLPLIVLKGPALAHTMYPDPSWRPFGDLDVLVRSRDWETACEVVRALGFVRDLPEPRAGFDRRFGKAATHTNEGGLQVDLHRTLALGPFGLWMDPDDLFARTVEFRLGGKRLRRLADPVLFLHACVHASLGWRPPLLLPLRDVAQVASSAEVDPSDVADLARRWRIGAVVEHASWAATELAPEVGDVLGRLTAAVEPTDLEHRALTAYTTGRRRRGGMALATIRAIPGLRSKVTYVGDLLVPSREFLGVRGVGRASYLRRWGVPVRWLRGGGRST